MTNQELVRRTLQEMREYKERYTPAERWAHMVASGIINEKGEVLVTEEEQGRPPDRRSAPQRFEPRPGEMTAPPSLRGQFAHAKEAQPIQRLAHLERLNFAEVGRRHVVPLSPLLHIEAAQGRFQANVERRIASSTPIQGRPLSEAAAVAEGVDARPGFIFSSLQ